MLSNEQVVTPLEFPSPTSKNMDLTSNETKTQLAEIEIKLADQQTQNAQMLNVLNNTLQLLAGMTQNQNTAVLTAQSPLPVASTTKPKNDLKPSPPQTSMETVTKVDDSLMPARHTFASVQIIFRMNKQKSNGP
jgi:hypothetical protein